MSRKSLAIESLEARWCPALTATLDEGVLTISGSADNGSVSVAQDSTTAGTFTVSDGSTAVSGSPFADVTSIRFNLTTADDNVSLDLGGQTFDGSVRANLGGGTDSFTVQNGELSERLAILSNFGHGKHHHRRGGAATDAGADTITIANSATVGSLAVRTAQAGANVSVAGTLTGSLNLDAYLRSGATGGATVSVSGEVDGSVRFHGTSLADSLTISGNVGGSVLAATGSGDDTVTISGAVTGRLALETGAGNDSITLSNVVGRRTVIAAGAGNDSLTMTATSQFIGAAVISMGAGTDAVTLDDAATIATMLINGGSGTDTFTGTPTRTGLRLISF